ncbi:MAG: DNA-directed RNA polymerase subunit B, partial [Candidatus Lokiarchaeota archaeon]|nr:DNA-directed RNA polymerase subunit B [Candidatus Lokiarchaeota archaeon]
MLKSSDFWVLMNTFFKEKGLVRQHLDSYNRFLDETLQKIVDEVEEIVPEIEGYRVRLGNIRIKKPSVVEADGSEKQIYPIEGRIRNLTYSGSLFLEMTPITVDSQGIEMEGETVQVYIGRLPIMLRSNKCLLNGLDEEELIKHGEDPRDPGGYFIINGSERVLVTREDLAPNRIISEESSRSRTSTHESKVFSTSQGFRAPVTLERRRNGELRLSFPSVPGKIPLIIVLRALGIIKDKDIMELITDDMEIRKELIPSLEKAIPLYVAKDEEATIKNALDYIGKRVAVGQTKEYRLRRAGQVLDKYLLPHIGRDENARIKKAYYIGQMTQKLLELALNKREEDDKDHYSNKRLKLAGDLLTSLFRVAFLQLTRDIKYQLERTSGRGRQANIRTAVRADVVTERLRHALATGNWVGGKTGVSQLLNRTNYISALSHLRRVVSPLSRSQPHFEARDLHPTHWGKICPSETPEGPNCGLVKNLALMAYISVGTDEEKVENKLLNFGIQPIEELRNQSYKKGARVFLNGILIGIHTDPEFLTSQVKQKRRTGELDDEVNIAYYKDTDEIQINCDAGRARRALIIVENGVPKLTHEHIEKLKNNEWAWNDLIQNGLVEYLDAEEEESTYIAMDLSEIDEETTHLEIAPSTILGITAAIIPFPEHNQSPRNTYEAGMAKQALGLYTANYKLRVDTRGHLLHYPQVPMVKTKAMDAIGFGHRPAGQNFLVGVISFQGYNIEDALIINKASIERGLARSSTFRCYDAEERKYPGGQEDYFEIPERSVRGYRAAESYRHLGEDGIIEPEVEISGGEVIIGRTSPPRFLEEYREFDLPAPTRRETSINTRHGETGIVDRVIVSETVDGNKLVKVKVRDQRIPELGDKFASRHGQKGIIGLIVPQEDMPFTENGVVPDLIINPHAIPSRMTVGQVIESIAGKVGALKGTQIDGTAFSRDAEELYDELQDLSFKYNGREVMYNGVSGEKYKADIFIGVVYYQKLHHMVSDKIHARARGPVQILTRQPTEGRAREGGLRFGEMERDCLVGHGAAILLKERLLDESDKCTVYICEQCGMLGVYDRNRDRYYCPNCGEKTTISQITISYAFKLLLQELMSLNIFPRLK